MFRLLARASTTTLILLMLVFSGGCSGQHGAAKRQVANPKVESLTPQGETTWPIVFAWRTNAAAETVRRVTIHDMAERLVFAQDTQADQYTPPPTLKATLDAVGRVQWKVSLIDDKGDVVAESPLVGMTLKK